MNSIELLTEVYRRRESGEATACQTCVSKCLSDKLEKGNKATDQDKAICFSECGCSNESNATELNSGRFEVVDFRTNKLMNRFESLDLAKSIAKKFPEQMKIVDTRDNKTVWVGESFASEKKIEDMNLAELKARQQEVERGLFELQHPPDSSTSFGSGRLTMSEIADIDRKGRKLLNDIKALISKKQKGEAAPTEEQEERLLEQFLRTKPNASVDEAIDFLMSKGVGEMDAFITAKDNFKANKRKRAGFGEVRVSNLQFNQLPDELHDDLLDLTNGGGTINEINERDWNEMTPFQRTSFLKRNGFTGFEVVVNATELKPSEMDKIFVWMERKADSENEGKWWSDLPKLAASQFGITPQQADNIWDSQGLEEVRANEIGINDIEIARKWNGASEFQRQKILQRSGHSGVGSDGGPPLVKMSFQGLPRSIQDDVIEFDIGGEGRPIKKGQTVAQWFNDMGRRGLADIGMDFQAGIMTPEFSELSASQKRQVRNEFEEQKNIDSGFTKENCGCKFTKYAGESVRLLEKVHGKEVAFMYGKITSVEGKKIKGTLAYAGVSHNNRLYLPEELQKGDMMNLPMIFNHASPDGAEFELSRLPNQIRESILNHEHIRVGDVKLHWDPENLTLFYEGEVNDEFFISEIDQGLMSVSLGMLFDADSPEICDQECYTAVKGSEFTEVSLVYHPGFPIATIESNEIRLKKRITPRRYKI